MTPTEIRTSRMHTGLSQAMAARLFRVKNARTWSRWESGEQNMPLHATVLLKVIEREPAALRALLELDAQLRGINQCA